MFSRLFCLLSTLDWVYGLFAERRRELKKLWCHRCYSQTNCEESWLHVDDFKHCRQKGDYRLIVFFFRFHLIRFTSCYVIWRARDMPGIVSYREAWHVMYMTTCEVHVTCDLWRVKCEVWSVMCDVWCVIWVMWRTRVKEVYKCERKKKNLLQIYLLLTLHFYKGSFIPFETCICHCS